MTRASKQTIWALIPVKRLHRTKSRLASVLSVSQRADLTCGLLEHQLNVLSQVDGVSQTVVVSRDPIIHTLAFRAGATVFVESAESDLNQSLYEAGEWVKPQADMMLVLPSDLPLISAETITNFISHAPSPAIAADRHGSGTNALLLPTTLPFEYQFGSDSFFKHSAQLPTSQRAIHPPEQALAFDLDTPDDWCEITPHELEWMRPLLPTIAAFQR